MHFPNPIWVVGKLETQLYIQFTRRMSEIIESSKEDDGVTVFINSSGGDTQVAMGLYDLLKSWPQRKVGIVAGRAESGASLILQACERRLITVNSTVMLHASSISIGNTSIENAQAAVNKFRAYDDKFFEIYAERAGASIDRIEDMAHRDVHFTAQGALTAGLVDEVIPAI